MSHSHSVMTRQPIAVRRSAFTRSRSTLRLNFLLQYSVWVLGRGRLHLGHRCQKQPFTKTATLCLVKQTSGLPGTVRRLHRYPRTPSFDSACLRRSSGWVQLERFPRIQLETAGLVAFGDIPKCSGVVSL